MENVRKLVIGNIEQLSESLDKAKPGSDESKVIADEIAKLYKVCIEDVESEIKVLNDDVNRQKTIADTKRINKELEAQPETEWYKQLKPDTVVSCSTIILLTLAAFRLEREGHILPRTLKYVDKLKVM